MNGPHIRACDTQKSLHTTALSSRPSFTGTSSFAHVASHRGIDLGGDFPVSKAFIPVEYIENPLYSAGACIPFADEFRDRILVHAIHAGDFVPEKFWNSWSAATQKEFEESHMKEKDWGADQIAARVAEELQISGYVRINIARIIMDFGRFPGISDLDSGHMHRMAIIPPGNRLFGAHQKTIILEEYYDSVSQALYELIHDKLLIVGIHTFDQFDSQHGGERPLTSVLYLPFHDKAQREKVSPFFDRLVPRVLSNNTANNLLSSRLTLHLAKAGLSTIPNYPYCLPEGSFEVRSQRWFFFRLLKQEFETFYPDKTDGAFQTVWSMLLDTDLRSAFTIGLLHYLHLFRKAPEGFEQAYEKYREAYETIEKFFDENGDNLFKEYEQSSKIPSSIAIEIRKDYVWRFSSAGEALPVRGLSGVLSQNVNAVAKPIAQAIIDHCQLDYRRRK